MKGRDRGETKSKTFTNTEEPITSSFQQRVKIIRIPPQIINPTPLQQYSMGGRGCGAHTRYGGGDRGRGSSYSSLGNSERPKDGK